MHSPFKFPTGSTSNDAAQNAGADGPMRPTNEQPVSQRRRHGRVRTEEVPSTIGQVLDLSASGMRISAGRKPPITGVVLEVGIQGVDGPFVVRAKVVWVTRKGLLGHEVGLAFEGVADNVRAELSSLARQAVACPTMITYRAAA